LDATDAPNNTGDAFGGRNNKKQKQKKNDGLRPLSPLNG
jgi:hypothetical protein